MRFADSAAEMAASAARYEPESMFDFFRETQRLPEALGNVAQALRITTQRVSSDWPLHDAVAETMAAVHGLLVQAAEAAAQVAPAMRRLHEADLERGENPRRHEALWNVQR